MTPRSVTARLAAWSHGLRLADAPEAVRAAACRHLLDGLGCAVAPRGVGGSGAGGLLEFLHSSASPKQLHPGTASLNGVLAARLAAAGGSGPVSVVEGRYGVLAALSARPADADTITADLGER